jgi:hypothetical protein
VHLARASFAIRIPGAIVASMAHKEWNCAKNALMQKSMRLPEMGRTIFPSDLTTTRGSLSTSSIYELHMCFRRQTTGEANNEVY